MPVWIRLGESAGLWEMFRSQQMTLATALAFLTAFPHLAGVMLSPGVSWAAHAPAETLVERVERSGGIAVRCPVPGYRYRETIIVPQTGGPRADTQMVADWYAQEDTWLD